jgi:SAM-dependent methyltransferase
MKQVGKTVNGVEVGEEQVTLIARHISKALDLSLDDSLMDLCCGNGILTVRLAESVGSAMGVDFTQGLLAVARERYARPNLSYVLANILELSSQQLASVNCFCMYEGIQHLSLAQFSVLMMRLALQPSGTRFFIGGIPDQRRLHNFYNTEEKIRFYQEREQAGRPHLGRWWGEGEIRKLATQAGYSMKTIEQPYELYTAHYRFDVLLERQA